MTTSARGLQIPISSSMLCWLVEVSWVTAMSSGRVPSARVRPSSAAVIMARVPAACRFTMSTSSADSTAIAF